MKKLSGFDYWKYVDIQLSEGAVARLKCVPWVQTPQNPDISLNRSIEAFDQRATCAWVPLAFPLKLRYTCPRQKLQTWCHTRVRARTFFYTKQWANTTLVAMFGIKEWSNYLGWWLLATTSSQMQARTPKWFSTRLPTTFSKVKVRVKLPKLSIASLVLVRLSIAGTHHPRWDCLRMVLFLHRHTEKRHHGAAHGAKPEAGIVCIWVATKIFKKRHQNKKTLELQNLIRRVHSPSFENPSPLLETLG